MKSRIIKSFSKASEEYANRADMQAEIAYGLCELLADGYYTNTDVKALDVGCGTGFVAQAFDGLLHFMQLDSSRDMCEIASQFGDTVQGDMNSLPFKDASFDLVTSSMALQWSDDLVKTFAEVNRVLVDGGIFAFTVPNDRSFTELLKLFHEIDKDGSINVFPEEGYLGSLVELSGFLPLNFSAREIISEFDDVLSLLKSFKEVGANISKSGGNILTKSDLKYLQDNYPVDNGKILLNWDINYVICKK